MQLIIHTEKDLRFLQGKFIVQLNNNESDKQIMDLDWDFVKAKRLFIVAGTRLIDLHGNISSEKTFEQFKNFFNHYLFDHTIKEGETDGGRFHRLLTSQELEYLFKKIKEENY